MALYLDRKGKTARCKLAPFAEIPLNIILVIIPLLEKQWFCAPSADYCQRGAFSRIAPRSRAILLVLLGI